LRDDVALLLLHREGQCAVEFLIDPLARGIVAPVGGPTGGEEQCE
jgi:hypothetical protein